MSGAERSRRTREQAAVQEFAAGLLERSIGFASGTLQAVTSGVLHRPTPCRGWDLHMLLRHVDDSLAALYEAFDLGTVRLDGGPGPGPDGDPAEAVGARAARLLGLWTAAGRDDRVITVGGCPLRAGLVAGTGAVEIAVHAWDIARAAGRPAPVPPALAAGLLRIAPMLAGAGTRQGLFDPPVPVDEAAPPGDRLVAFLGRDPSR